MAVRRVSPRGERRQAGSGVLACGPIPKGMKFSGVERVIRGRGRTQAIPEERGISPTRRSRVRFRKKWEGKQVPPPECPVRSRRERRPGQVDRFCRPSREGGRPGAPGSASATPARLVKEIGNDPRTPGCGRTQAVKKAFGPPRSLSSVVSRGFPMPGFAVASWSDSSAVSSREFRPSLQNSRRVRFDSEHCTKNRPPRIEPKLAGRSRPLQRKP